MFAGRPIIGIAGGIGAGKSRVARLFESLGCCRVGSDEMVHAAYTHPRVKAALLERFGDTVLDERGDVDRKALSAVVFRDAEARRWLERLVHPIANAARVEVMSAAASDPRIAAYVWDSPLLFETNLDELCDDVVFVDAPRDDRLRRVAERGWDAGELDRREAAQMPLDVKRERCGFTITNSDAEAATADAARATLDLILDRHGAGEAAAGCGAGDACCGGTGCCGAAADAR